MLKFKLKGIDHANASSYSKSVSYQNILLRILYGSKILIMWHAIE